MCFSNRFIDFNVELESEVPMMGKEAIARNVLNPPRANPEKTERGMGQKLRTKSTPEMES